jgi:DNA repair exonuclease SbcCD ATPase subunit
MRAERLELVNFCQHHRRVIEFQPGLTAIIGPNGSGKSNIMGGMKYALTGEHPNVGGKDANIRHGRPDGERAYAEFTFAHGDAHATVRRNLAPAAPTTLTVNGHPVARGDRAVNAWILAALGTDTQIINDIVIVDQEDIFSFLSQIKSKRSESFAKLFGTDRAKTINRIAGEHLTNVQLTALPAELAAVTAAITTDENRLAEIQAHLGEETSENIQTAIYNGTQTVNFWNRKCEVAQEIDTAENARVPLMRSHTNAQEAKKKAEVNVATLEEAAAATEPLAKDAQRILTLMDQAKQYDVQKKAIMDEIAGHEVKLTTMVDPQKPERHGTDWVSLLAESDDALSRCRERIVSLRRSLRDKACATCDTAVTDVTAKLLDQKLIAAEADEPKLQQARTEVNAELNRCATYDRELDQIRSNRRHEGELLATAQRRLEGLQSVEVTTDAPSDESLRELVKSHDEFVSAIGTYKQESATHGQTVARLAGRLQELSTQIDQANTRFSDILVTKEQYEIAEAENERLAVQLEEVQALEKEMVEINTRLDHNRPLRQQCIDVARANGVKERWRTKIQRVRDVTHWDAAPRAVAERNLVRIRQGVNANLDLFAADYRVSNSEDLSFRAHFPDGRVQPAARLSGGQKVVLALGFRLAVNFMYANLGFLALDEPTAYLDEHYIAGFEPVLGRLREFAASRGFQCLMVTHEQSLAPLFDSVIQL